MRNPPPPLQAVLFIALLVASGCGESGDRSGDGAPESDSSVSEQREIGTVSAQVAVYEPVAGNRQRFRLGLVTDDGRLISFGEISLHFAYAGTEEDPIPEPVETITADASYILVAGQEPPADTTGPRVIKPSEGVGVYNAEVTFDKPGTWAVHAVASIGGNEVDAAASFDVLETPNNPFPGEPAPRTQNRKLDTPGVDPTSIDSRADDNGTIPDPELHALTVAEALETGKPLMVVVSTPTYCVSRFCGPITDSIQELAAVYGDDMSFIHVEVWNDYEKQAVNREAADWIYRNREADLTEPWVFLVGADGIIIDRWDNVSTDVELESAVLAVVE